MHVGYWWESQKDTDHYDYFKLDLREIGCGGMDWIDLAHDRDQWRVLVNAGMDLEVP
jgi:hypothetical protein